MPSTTATTPKRRQRVQPPQGGDEGGEECTHSDQNVARGAVQDNISDVVQRALRRLRIKGQPRHHPDQAERREQRRVSHKYQAPNHRV
jgi:hypothetical protein